MSEERKMGPVAIALELDDLLGFDQMANASAEADGADVKNAGRLLSKIGDGEQNF